MNKIQFLNTSYLPVSLQEQMMFVNYHEDENIEIPQPQQNDQQSIKDTSEIEMEDNYKYSYTEEFDPLELYMQELY